MARLRKKKFQEFNKYFWKTFKEGKYLLLKYLVTSILMIVVAVLSNLLGVKELTYLNAFLALNCFASLVSFGVSNGMNVLINQSIGSKFKVNKFAQVGFEINLIFLTLMTICLVAFPQFFMEVITSYLPTDYTFYYIMCGYFFLSGLNGYLQYTMKELSIFKLQFYCEIIPIIVTVLSLAILYFCGIYYLNYVAIGYVLSAAIGFVMVAICMAKNKTFKVNIFKFRRLKLTKKQWGIILSNLATEVVWQVGYYATSMLLFRFSEGIFNTYSYLEIVLDIFNGVLFAYINITCIRITRCLGTDRFERAYKHAKYSIYSVIAIWGFYFVASMLFIYPIALGVNKAYFSIMFLAIPCYVVLHLFRFLSWNFSSYMLRLGGKNKAILAMEIARALMFVGICFIVKFLPNNIFLAYVLVASPDILFLPVQFIMFALKKWLANVNKDPMLLKNKVKCVVFDFDDTIYYGVDWTFWYKMAYAWFNEHFSSKTPLERQLLLKKYGVHKNLKNFSDEKLCSILLGEEGSADKWLDYRDKMELADEEKKAKCVSMSEIKKFAKLGKLYILSNSREKNIKKFAEYHNLDLSIFEKIVTNQFAKETSKEGYLKEIMEDNNLKPENILMIGNSYRSDILPAKKLKMNYYKVKNGFSYNEIIN